MGKTLPYQHYEFFENATGSTVMIKTRLKILFQRLRALEDKPGMEIILEAIEEVNILRTNLKTREHYERAEFSRLYEIEEAFNGR